MNPTIEASALEALYDAVAVDVETVRRWDHDAKLDALGHIITAATKAIDNDGYDLAVVAEAVHVIDASLAPLGLKRSVEWPQIASSSHLALAETRKHANDVLLVVAANNIAAALDAVTNRLGGNSDNADVDAETDAWNRLVRSWHRLASKVAAP